MNRQRASDRVFVGLCALFFVVSAAVTIRWCGSMSSMGGMSMPGGWTMSMSWMRMPGQSWPLAAGTFLIMWLVMMAAMMLPSLTAMLSRYRQGVCCRRSRLGWLTAIVASGYFFIWTVTGLIAFAVGAALTALLMHSAMLARGVPVMAGIVVLLAGLLQFTAWKARQLACCREPRIRASERPENVVSAWRHGVWLGLRCTYCCAGPTAILLSLGVMDLRAMALVSVAITAERLAPAGQRVARLVGFVIVVTGTALIAKAL